MGIGNGIGIINSEFRPERFFEGFMDQFVKTFPYHLRVRQQTGTVTVGGTATDGLYSITFETDAETFVVDFTRGSSESLAAIRDALVADANASGNSRLQDIIEVSAGATNVLDYEVLAYGQEVRLTVAAPSPGTLTPAVVSSAAETELRAARFYAVDNSNPDYPGLQNLGAASTSDDVAAYLGIASGAIVNDGGFFETDAYDSPAVLPGAYYGLVAVRNVGPGSILRDSVVHIVRNTAGGDELGQVRNVADGANTIAMPRSRMRGIDNIPSGQIGRIFIEL